MKIIKANQVGKLIKDNSQVMIGGFIGSAVPEEIIIELREYYLKHNKPNNITLIFCAGQGDGKDRGINHLAYPGLVNKVIGGHFGLSPKLTELINENLIEGYNLPQGIMSHLIRATVAKVPYIVSKVGLHTFVDPRLEGGKLNKISTQDYVEYINDGTDELLKYHTFNPNIALLRGTYSDKKGNISFAKEGLTLDSLSMAQAAKTHNGIVIVQVEKVVDEIFNPKEVVIPHVFVDYVIETENLENHMQTFKTQFNEDFVTNKDIKEEFEIAPLNDRKIIARRAAMQLTKQDKILNYGIGIPEVVANVLNEEDIADNFVPTVEPGIIGGSPQGGLDFGMSKYPDMILDQASQFDFYDGNGIDCAFLGLAQADKFGNLNVSKFGPKIAGCGGFINISQNAKKVVFCGTFMVGAKTHVEDGKLVIDEEGRAKKFIEHVEQITFSGKYALKKKSNVIYITERAVFDLDNETGILRLIEIAPGIDLQKDIIDHMNFKPEISENLKEMDKRIFKDQKMNLKLKESGNTND